MGKCTLYCFISPNPHNNPAQLISFPNEYKTFQDVQKENSTNLAPLSNHPKSSHVSCSKNISMEESSIQSENLRSRQKPVQNTSIMLNFTPLPLGKEMKFLVPWRWKSSVASWGGGILFVFFGFCGGIITIIIFQKSC